MSDYLCAPFPYLVGVHSSAIEAVKKMPLDSVLFCNLDQKTLSGLLASDLVMLPPVQVNALAGRLERAREKGLGTVAWNLEVFEIAFFFLFGDVFSFVSQVQEAFLHSICSVMGPFRRYYMGLFDKEGYLTDCAGSAKRYLAQLVEAQCFQSFLERRKEPVDDEFEKRVERENQKNYVYVFFFSRLIDGSATRREEPRSKIWAARSTI